MADPEPRLSNQPSLLENALSQEIPGVGGSSDISHTPWPAAPDITRETRNSLRDNGLEDWSVPLLKADEYFIVIYYRGFDLLVCVSARGRSRRRDS